MSLKQAIRYRKALIEGGAIMQNIKNWVSHWLYGTHPEILIRQSKRGIVYNPPGH